jgi:hypothetical protein
MVQLQGASLAQANLQGASLFNAQLQGAFLNNANLQGASLNEAKFQGASLIFAELQGASLHGAQLQGASLFGAQLQGANLTEAFLWRAELENSVLENIFDRGGEINWSPMARIFPFPRIDARPWTDATYAELRQSIEREVPEGSRRTAAVGRVAILDCKRKGDDALASCDSSEAPPEAVTQWKKKIEDASIDYTTYAKALTVIVGDLVCSYNDDRIYVLRGLMHSDPDRDGIAIGSEMPALAKRITRAECPVSTALSDAEKRFFAAALHKPTTSP